MDCGTDSTPDAASTSDAPVSIMDCGVDNTPDAASTSDAPVSIMDCGADSTPDAASTSDAPANSTAGDNARVVRSVPVSGRQWKARDASRASKKSGASAKQHSWDEKQQQKRKLSETQEAEKTMRAAKGAIIREKRKKGDEKKKRKLENEMKSVGVQIVKNTTAVRNWNKKARKQLVKMSAEQILSLYKVKL